MDFTLFIFVILLEYAHSQSQPNPVPSPGCGQPTPESGTFTIGHGGYTRTYIVHQPTNYDINTPIPFVFNFHGYTGTAQGFRNFWYGDANANDMNYLNVYVESTNGANRNSWNDIGCSSSPGPAGPTCNYGTVSDVPIPSICPRDQGPGLNDGYCNWCNCEANDIDFIDYLGGIIEQNYCIDISREYALGYSQGGMMAHTVGCQLNGRFAAIAPFHGQEQIGFNCPVFNMVYPIGIINVWGTLDTVVCGESPTLSHYEDGCESSDGYWYTKVSAVQRRFAQHNGCDIEREVERIESAADGIRGWQCTGYTEGCTDGAYVMQCSWDGRHTYPIEVQQQYNFGLAVVVEYFYQFQHPRFRAVNSTVKTY